MEDVKLEEEDKGWETYDKACEIENFLERFLENQKEQFLRLNKNIEIMNVILGEISVGLSRE